MEITKDDLYFSAPVFLDPPTEISRYSAWNTHLKFYYFGLNLLTALKTNKNANSNGVVL